MTETKCPKCRKRTLEEHGTNPGDRHWWFCRNCGLQLYELDELHEELNEELNDRIGRK